MTEVTVSLAHLREIYRMTDSSLIKNLIEIHYPKASKKSNAEEAIEETFNKFYDMRNGSPIISRVEVVEFYEIVYVVVSLPNANTKWTLESFEFVKRFVELHSDSYPVHNMNDEIKKLTTMDNFLVIKYNVF